MNTIFPGATAIILYLISTYYQGRNFSERKNQFRRITLISGFIAFIAHIVITWAVIVTPEGYQFGFFQVSVLISCLVSGLILFSSLKKPVENLFLILFPMAAISILAVLFTTPSPKHLLELSPGIVTHILLSIFAYSMLTISLVQAILLAYQNRQLKQKKLPKGVLNRLPPLQTMETLLFEILWLGILLLSLSIISGFYFVEGFLENGMGAQAPKSILSIVAWIAFAILLFGRHQLGWRGYTASKWTIIGFIILMLAYFGNKLLMEF